MRSHRSLILAVAIAALPPGPGHAQAPTICGQPFDGDIVRLHDRIRQAPGAVAMPSRNPNFDVINVEPQGHIWNFTKAGHAAHPSVACRQIVRVGDAFSVRTEIQCRAAKAQCDKLAADYNALDREMTEAIRRGTPKQ